jgi:hypothetical protein
MGRGNRGKNKAVITTPGRASAKTRAEHASQLQGLVNELANPDSKPEVEVLSVISKAKFSPKDFNLAATVDETYDKDRLLQAADYLLEQRLITLDQGQLSITPRGQLINSEVQQVQREHKQLEEQLEKELRQKREQLRFNPSPEQIKNSDAQAIASQILFDERARKILEDLAAGRNVERLDSSDQVAADRLELLGLVGSHAGRYFQTDKAQAVDNALYKMEVPGSADPQSRFLPDGDACSVTMPTNLPEGFEDKAYSGTGQRLKGKVVNGEMLRGRDLSNHLTQLNKNKRPGL